tara:strand:- start:3 stop:929 length:927 start_codon:yes stop_codon:yes gene_type:complete
MQQTIKKSLSVSGITLHNGSISNLTIYPATANTGIVFKRVDLKISNKESLIAANLNNVSTSDLCTKITNKFGISVSTIEHLMSALHGMGVDNAIVEVDCNELPILDGSSIEYVRNIEAVGLRSLNVEKRFISITRPIVFRMNDSFVKVSPSDQFSVDYTISYDHDLIKEQRFYYEFKDSNQFKNLISNCRTFGFKEEVDSLRKKGLIAGGSLDNAIVLDREGIVNNDKLRQENEFVKHKILDFIGDIYLLEYSVKGAFEIYKGGHRLTHETMRSIMSDQSNWNLINEQDLQNKKYHNTYYPQPIAVSL